MRIRGCVSTDAGKKHGTCTDAAVLKIAASTRYGRVAFALLSDGLEDATGSGNVSAMAAERYAQWFQEELPDILQDAEEELRIKKSREGRMLTEVLYSDMRRSDFSREMLDTSQEEICHRLAQITEELHIRIAGYGRLHGIRAGCAVTCLLLMGGEYLLMRVGASRAYLTGEDGLKPLSAQGAEQEAATFGGQRIGTPVFVRGTYERRTGFLLCSDGFTRRQDPGHLRKMCRQITGASERRMLRILRKMTRHVRRKGEEADAFAVYLGVV